MPRKPLLKALTDAGIGSRRRMADAVKQGKVEVNGAIAESFNLPVNVGRDRIYLNGQKLDLRRDETVCLMLNKPEGVVSTVSDEKGRPTVLDFIPAKYHKYRLYPVGRLDIDTTGLLLLTNDGDLTYALTHPKFEQEKEYLVQIDGHLQREELRRLEEGIRLEDGVTAPARVKRANSPPYTYRIVIHEGRKRQVRRMFEHLGYPVKALKRVRVGMLLLGDLEEGLTRPVWERELKNLTATTRKPAARQPSKKPFRSSGNRPRKPSVKSGMKPKIDAKRKPSRFSKRGPV